MMKQHEANKCIRVNVCFENTMQNGVVWGIGYNAHSGRFTPHLQ